MGSAHYWYRYEVTHDQKMWNAFLQDVKTVANLFDLGDNQPTLNIAIRGGRGTGTPVFDENEICFNGEDCSGVTLNTVDGVIDNSCETFRIQREVTRIRDRDLYQGAIGFDFCKTQLLPYDLLATAVLTLYKYHFQDKVYISTDHGLNEFEHGVKLVQKTLGYDITSEQVFEETNVMKVRKMLTDDY